MKNNNEQIVKIFKETQCGNTDFASLKIDSNKTINSYHEKVNKRIKKIYIHSALRGFKKRKPFDDMVKNLEIKKIEMVEHKEALINKIFEKNISEWKNKFKERYLAEINDNNDISDIFNTLIDEYKEFNINEFTLMYMAAYIPIRLSLDSAIDNLSFFESNKLQKAKIQIQNDLNVIIKKLDTTLASSSCYKAENEKIKTDVLSIIEALDEISTAA